MKYYIYSFEHDGYWKSDRFGYTPNLSDAGIFSETEALEITLQANIVMAIKGEPNEAMIPLKED